MSQLRIFNDTDGTTPVGNFSDHVDMARELATIGVRFEQWQANRPIAPGAEPEAVLAAYNDDIERLKREGGYTTVDVISIAPDNPKRVELRQKFLAEHTHSEDEVRFFVAGSGQFTLHVDNKVYDILCETGDLIGVPDGTRHWFDMSEAPSFVAIRLFTNPEGWVARLTGDDISARFPRMQPARAEA
ncbi:MAG TPA: acireductone dioxygenase [Rhodanobacteraceae bacterium]